MIGAKNAVCYDLNAACSGFVYAYCTAQAFIRGGIYKTILIIGAESLSNLVNVDGPEHLHPFRRRSGSGSASGGSGGAF